MNIDYLHILVVSLFIGQLFTLSVYVSNHWRRSRTKLITQYPQASFPNLYVRPEKEELQRLTYRKHLDYFALLIGLSVLAWSFIGSLDPLTLSRYMMFVAAIQISPLMLSGYWCTKNCNAMKERFPEKVRHASMLLAQRDTKQIVFSCLSVCLFVISLLLGWMLLSTIETPELVSQITKILWLNVLVFTAIVSMFLTMVYGKKTDNFAQPAEYEARQRNKKRYLAISLCAFQGFILYILTTKAFDLSTVYVSLVTSIVVQGIVLSTKEQYFPINPNAYK